jgi:tetratricopeptide (TPR) repeat protein
LLLAAISAWVWRERSHPYLISGWCWFLGMLVPVIGLVQVGDQGMADRYAYLPLMGIFVMVVWGLAALRQNASGGRRRSAAPAVIGVLLLFSVLAWRQVRFWNSSYDLWTHTLAVTENNSFAEDVIGNELLDDDLNKGLRRSAQAQIHFQNALKINPKDGDALLNIGADLQAHGRMQEAIEKYRLAQQYSQDPFIVGKIFTNLGAAYEQLGDFAAARQHYRKAIDIMKTAAVPGAGVDPAAFMGFARTFTDEEIVKLAQTLHAHPTAKGYWQLGQLQEGGGYTEAAGTSYEHARLLDPKFEAAREALGRISSRRKP